MSAISSLQSVAGHMGVVAEPKAAAGAVVGKELESHLGEMMGKLHKGLPQGGEVLAHGSNPGNAVVGGHVVGNLPKGVVIHEGALPKGATFAGLPQGLPEAHLPKGLTLAGGNLPKGLPLEGGHLPKGLTLAGGNLPKGLPLEGGQLPKGLTVVGGELHKGTALPEDISLHAQELNKGVANA